MNRQPTLIADGPRRGATIPCVPCGRTGFAYSEVACPRCLEAGTVDAEPDAPLPLELSRATRHRLTDVVRAELISARSQAAEHDARVIATSLLPSCPPDPVSVVARLGRIDRPAARRLVERWAYAAEERSRALRAEFHYRAADWARAEERHLEGLSARVLARSETERNEEGSWRK